MSLFESAPKHGTDPLYRNARVDNSGDNKRTILKHNYRLSIDMSTCRIVQIEFLQKKNIPGFFGSPPNIA